MKTINLDTHTLCAANNNLTAFHQVVNAINSLGKYIHAYTIKDNDPASIKSIRHTKTSQTDKSKYSKILLQVSRVTCSYWKMRKPRSLEDFQGCSNI